MNYFRAVVKSGEVSKRVFNLTTVVIEQLPSNYNVWYVRRKCVDFLHINPIEELNYLNSITDGNEKVYQIWEYRRQIVQLRNSADGELTFLDGVMDLDNKNYHAWIYRIWLCGRFGLWEEERVNV